MYGAWFRLFAVACMCQPASLASFIWQALLKRAASGYAEALGADHPETQRLRRQDFWVVPGSPDHSAFFGLGAS